MSETNEIDVLVTYDGDQKALEKLLHSIIKNYKALKITIADTSGLENRDFIRTLNESLGKQGHLLRLHYFPTPGGASWQEARNHLIRQTTNKYKLFVDCHQEFTEETKLEAMVDILERHPSIGMVLGLEGEAVSLDENNREEDQQSIWYRLVRLAALPSRFMLCHIDIFWGASFKPGDEQMSELAGSLQTRVSYAAALLPSVRIKKQDDENQSPNRSGGGGTSEPNIQSANGGSGAANLGVQRGQGKTEKDKNFSGGQGGSGAGSIRRESH